MDQLLALLGVPPGGTLFIRGVQLAGWGRDLTFRCVYRGADGGESHFRLTLADCRELQWRVYVVGEVDETPLVDVVLGRGGHRSPAKLLAGAFGLTAVYGELRVESDGGV